jgi:Flp pilus assembly protein TadB
MSFTQQIRHVPPGAIKVVVVVVIVLKRIIGWYALIVMISGCMLLWQKAKGRRQKAEGKRILALNIC